MLAQITELLNANLGRVENLITVYQSLARQGRGRQPVTDQDILRAALVLLHASMEDFLRSLLVWRAPHGTKDHLNDYPLAGSGKKHSESFRLGALVAHKGKQVDELIEESVREYLEQYASFNNLGEVKEALLECGVGQQSINNQQFQLNSLAAMISRRHKIVHKADRNEVKGGQGNHQVASLSVVQLNDYLSAVKNLRDFVGRELAHL